MSQKKLKKLKKMEFVGLEGEKVWELISGFRQIVKENWKFLLCLFLGVFLLYFNSLKGAFVSDDYASIPQNSLVTNFTFMFQEFVSTSNWFLATVFGIVNPVPYHLLSLVLYIFICGLAFVFLTILFDKNIARWSVVIFAALPIHVETVSWISGKPYLFNSFFVLLSLIVLVLYLRTGTKKYFWTLLCLIPLTFIAEKIRFMSFLFLAILYFVSFKEKIKIKINWSKVILSCCFGILVLMVILWPSIIFRVNNVNGGYNGSGGIFYDPFFQYPTAMAKYLQLALFPVDLTLYHTMYIFPVWLNWLIFLSYLSGVTYYFFKDKKMFFALAFIFVATAPSMAPIKVSWLVAERYLLLGSLGLCLFLVLFFQKFGEKWKLPIYILFFTLVGVYSIRVYLRNIDWETNHNLWVSTCQVSPNSHNAWNNIGDDYDKLGQYENAIKGFTQSTVVKPNYADAYHNRANIFFKTGRLDLARDSYNTALVYSPGLYQTYLSLIQIDLTEKKYDLALEHSKKYVDMQPNDPQAWYVYGVVNSQAGLTDEALKIFSLILEKYPSYKPAKDAMIQLTQQS